MVLVKDLIAFIKRTSPMMTNDVVKGSKKVGSFMTVRYHNKGIEMLELPKILHSKSVMNTIPQFLSNRKPPRVSYSYTKTIASRVFNQKKVVEDLDFDIVLRICNVIVLHVNTVMNQQDMLLRET